MAPWLKALALQGIAISGWGFIMANSGLALLLRLKLYVKQPKVTMKFFQNLRCRFAGHPVPGVAGQFVAPVPFEQPEQNLPYLDAKCPRCGAALKLYFIPGTQGMDTCSRCSDDVLE